MTLHMRDQENFDNCRMQEKIDIAKNLLSFHNDFDISAITGLDINQVAKIREEHQ